MHKLTFNISGADVCHEEKQSKVQDGEQRAALLSQITESVIIFE